MALAGGAAAKAKAYEVSEGDLESWQVIGAGGFGQVFGARHRLWCCHVAVKLLEKDDGSGAKLLHEVKMMRQASCPQVTQVLGLFRGRPPGSHSLQLGLVMEFMERGSLADMQRALQGPPPGPLLHRLAHQVALGLTFLHGRAPPLLHLDLKPSNVLLDPSLNAKLTDFGLAKFSYTMSRVSRNVGETEAGTHSYMPPEAFSSSYTPRRASDIYSYGILLWSIITGKQPYANVEISIVYFRIPLGDRPSLKDFPAPTEGGAELKKLMERCWDGDASKRPPAVECAAVTEAVHAASKRHVHEAVLQVLQALDRKAEEDEAAMTEQLNKLQLADRGGVNDGKEVPTGSPPVQEVARDGAPKPPRVSSTQEVLRETAEGGPSASLQEESKDFHNKTSSVHPIQASPPSRDSRKPSRGDRLSSHYQRPSSSPGNFSAHFSPPPAFHISFSHVVGVQYGNNNTMNIRTSSPRQRRRHPTAPL